MEKAPQKKSAKATASPKELASLEIDQDAWPKFEALVKSAAKMGHRPHGERPVKKRVKS